MIEENSQSLHSILSDKLNFPTLVDVLADPPLYKISPILIEVAKRRASKITPQELLKTYNSKEEFYGISGINQREILKFKLDFYSILPESFEAVELSPISPLGTNSVLSSISQNKVMSTTRGSEVVGDPTTSLILESASRRKLYAKKADTINKGVEIASFHRVLRMQPFEKAKGYMQQFNLLGLVTSSRENFYLDFIAKAMSAHISILLDFIDKLNSCDYQFGEVTVSISSTQIIESLISRFSIPREGIIQEYNVNEGYDFINKYNLDLPKVVSCINEINIQKIDYYGLNDIFLDLLKLQNTELLSLKNKFKNVKFNFNINRVAGLGYYKDYCFHIYATNRSGRRILVSDGGAVDYIERMLSDKKECAFTSGMGVELVQKLFKVN